ncbi:MAG TPA: hypothetical protein VFA59_02095 [Vicinamibacterales bacterium]|nr:hypothetical protein [Vicinamibacterales bacterium]
MRRVATLVVVIGLTAAVQADVRTDEKSKVEFGGALGRFVNIFGGKGAREGVTSTVAVKGDRKARLNDMTGQIIDLGEEKIYDLDMRKKTVKVTTFAELRRRMEEAQKKAEADAQKEQPSPPQPQQASKPEKEMQIDVDVKNTGQKKSINGFDTHEVILTITAHEKGKKVEESGGMVLTSDMWMAPTIAAMKEIADFDRRYYEKLYGPVIGDVSAEQMAAAMALYPLLKSMLGRVTTEGGKLDGTAIQTTTTIDGVKSAEEMAQAQKEKADDSKNDAKGGVGGLVGGFARRMAQKKMGSDDSNPRSTVMTLNNEVVKVTSDVTAADVAVPAGFKEGK